MENINILKEQTASITRAVKRIQQLIAFKQLLNLNDPLIEHLEMLIKINDLIIPERMQHPIYKKYWGLKNGDLYSEYTNKISKMKNANGYIFDCIYLSNKKKKYVQRNRFIYECYYQTQIEKFLQIDHINSKSLDNSIINLQKLSQKEHNQKTLGGKPNKSKYKTSKKIICFTLNNKNERDNIFYFDSIHEGALFVSTDKFKTENLRKNISEVLRGNQTTCRGYFWEIVNVNPEEKYKNEIWKKLCEIDNIFLNSNSEISSCGRVKSEYGIITTGSKNKGYCRVKIQKKYFLVHTLVAMAFIGNKPSNNHTVDHINRIKDDNRKENLRWATSSEQQDNCNAKSINVFNEGKFVSNYKSITVASNKLNLSRASIYACVQNRQKTHKGYTFELVERKPINST
jgi:hypothetical protein